MGNTSSNTLNEQLLDAVRKGEIDKVKELYNNGANINYRDSNSSTVLMWACAMGHTKIVELLISFGSNLTDRDKDDYTCLHFAVTEKKYDVIKLLITKYKNKIDVNAKNKSGDTPLHRSIYYSQKQISTLLIQNGANINSVNNLNETPLDKARKNDIKIWLKSLGGTNNTKDFQIEGNKVDDNKVSLNDDDKQYIKRKNMKENVVKWLKVDLSLSEYIDNFINSGYDRFDAIITMDKQDLVDIGIKKGHIKIILESIQQYKQNQQQINQYQPGMDDNNNQNDNIINDNDNNNNPNDDNDAKNDNK